MIGQTVAEISRFLSFFKMSASAILHFKKIGNFIGRSAVRGQYASPCQISQKSVKRLQRYGDYIFFENGGRPPYWICWVRYWDHRRQAVGGLYLCAKIG